MDDESIKGYVLMIVNVVRECNINVNMMDATFNVDTRALSSIFNILKEMIEKATSLVEHKADITDKDVIDFIANRIVDKLKVK